MQEPNLLQSSNSGVNPKLLGLFKVFADIKIRLDKEERQKSMQSVFERQEEKQLTPAQTPKVEKLKQNKPVKTKIWAQTLIQEGVHGTIETIVAAPGTFITASLNGRY